ncbi:MAG: HupE/UreJ family protein [Steroidobacteraceae bacterium]
MRSTLRPLLALLLLAAATQVAAHTKSTSYSNWRIEGADVHLSFTVPLVETARLNQAGETQPPNERVETYLAERLTVSAGGKDCPLTAPVKPLAASVQFRRFELNFKCPSDKDIALHSAVFFDLVPSHVSLAQIQTSDGRLIQQLFTKDEQTLATSGKDENMRDAGFLRYVQMGIMHIFTGVDHMSFLLGLVLISRRLRDLVFVVTGFTIGHSATLALAVTGIIRPHAEFIDALVALTIAMIGAENVAVATHRPGLVAGGVGGTLLLMAAASALGLGGLPSLLLLGAGLFAANYLMLSGHLRDAARLRIVVTVVFGLIHGFGFAADLLELRLPSGQLFSILLGFNLGVEVGQLTLVLVALGLVALLVKARLALPRPIVVDTLSAGLVGLGVFWFISRSYA